jgi:antitoxin (DNA-binding transcriptional repressor) of toxin-antitoxin stability system
MEKAWEVTEARMRLSTIVERVQRQGDTHHISRYGKPAAASVPLQVSPNWQRQPEEFFDLVGKLHNEPDLLPEETDRVNGEAVTAIRAVG